LDLQRAWWRSLATGGVAFACWVVKTRALVWFLVVVLLGSAVAGYIFWYGASILEAPWYLWIFVPDSPLSVTLMAAALVALHLGRRWSLLGLLAAGACIKYGLWTDLVWFADYLSGHGYGFIAVLMSVTHFGMVILGLVVMGFIRYRPLPVLVASLFLAANDFVDYVLGYHPVLPDLRDPGVVWRFAVVMTAVVVGAWAVLTWRSIRRVAEAGAPDPPVLG
jgi:uncharacterized membrane protein YpjA